jgi:head-tail adaptor
VGRAGQRRHFLEIQASSESDGPDGETLRTWGVNATAWGNIRPLGGRELIEARQVDARASHGVEFPFIDCRDLSQHHRIMYRDPERGDRVFNIRHRADQDERRREWTLIVEEIFDHEEA